MNNSKFLAMILALMLFTGTAIFADVLVYDNNTNNSYAQTAAASFGEPVTVGQWRPTSIHCSLARLGLLYSLTVLVPFPPEDGPTSSPT